jgi:8-oxo-dGTP diphosphatase
MNKVFHDSETPALGQQVITACAFIWYEFDGVKKVFMPKRADTKKFLPGVFELPGGHIDYGEQVEVGLAREIMEEFGMRVQIGEPFGVFTYTNHIKGSHSVEIVYFAQFLDPIDRIVLDPEDHSEYLWIAADQIDKIVSPSKPADDQEFKVIQKGFLILEG